MTWRKREKKKRKRERVEREKEWTRDAGERGEL